MVDVLLIGTMGNIAQTVRSSLEAHGLSVAEAPFPQNIFRDYFGYGSLLRRTLAQLTPRVIFPIGCATALSKLKPSVPAGIAVPVDDEEKMLLLDSKVRSSALAAELGIRQPLIYESIPDEDAFPLIFKRDVSFGGQGVHWPRSSAALLNLIEHQRKGEPYLIEEYVPGEDYSVDVIRWDSFFKASCYKTLSQQGKGPSRTRISVANTELEDIAYRILSHLDYKGVCGMDFRIAPDGATYFMECNPRFTGGLESSIAAGFDIPYILWQLATGENPSAGSITVKPGIITG